MQTEAKRNWTDALRSGAYEQTENRLHRPGKGYCCLGVLCAVSKAEFKETTYGESHPYLDGEPLHRDGSEYLSNEALKKFGLTDAQQKQLATMNDGMDGTRKRSFAEIADYIDANF